MCFQGVVPAGDGFKLDADELQRFGFKPEALPSVIRRYIIGKDLVQRFENRHIIDFFGLSENEVRTDHPTLYQHLLTRVYPERAENKRASYKEKWWIFAEPRPAMRRALNGLPRFIVTPYTAKHRPFLFVNGDTLPDAMAYAVASGDAFVLGVLSSRIHLSWALSAGGTLEDRPRYNSNATFLPFPFPLCNEAEKERIRKVAEELDAHRKRVQAQHPDLTLTGMYNVLEKLRAGGSARKGALQAPGAVTNRPSLELTAKERDIHDRGLVSLLKQLHDDLDAAVFAAYGWEQLWEWREKAHTMELYDFGTDTIALVDPAGEQGFHQAIADWERKLDAEILRRLVALNAQRAEEEKRGIIHWLRPDYQKKQGAAGMEQGEMELKPKKPRGKGKASTKPHSSSVIRHSSLKTPWPKSLADRIRATEQALHAAKSPVTPADLTQNFSRAKPTDLQEILESLVALGRARKDGERFGV